MEGELIIKILLSFCSAAMLIGVKILWGIAKNVQDIDVKFSTYVEKVHNLEKQSEKHETQILELQKQL